MSSRNILISEIVLAVVNQWPDFVEGVICSVIMAWHPLRIIENGDSDSEPQSTLMEIRTVFLDFRGKGQYRPVVWNGRLLVDPHNNVDTKKGFDLLRFCWGATYCQVSELASVKHSGWFLQPAPGIMMVPITG